MRSRGGPRGAGTDGVAVGGLAADDAVGKDEVETERSGSETTEELGEALHLAEETRTKLPREGGGDWGGTSGGGVSIGGFRVSVRFASRMNEVASAIASTSARDFVEGLMAYRRVAARGVRKAASPRYDRCTACAIKILLTCRTL